MWGRTTKGRKAAMRRRASYREANRLREHEARMRHEQEIARVRARTPHGRVKVIQFKMKQGRKAGSKSNLNGRKP